MQQGRRTDAGVLEPFVRYFEQGEGIVTVLTCSSRRSARDFRTLDLISIFSPFFLGLPLMFWFLTQKREIYRLCLTDRRLFSVQLSPASAEPIPESLWAAPREQLKYLGTTTWINSILHLEVAGVRHDYFVAWWRRDRLAAFALLSSETGTVNAR